MIKVVGIVLTALIINIVLKNYSKEFTFLINIVCTIIIFTLISKDLKGIVDRLTSISNEISVLLPYIKIMLKILGISMIAQLLSDLCRDNGENTLANQTELSAKIIILVTALPLFTTIMDIMIGMLFIFMLILVFPDVCFAEEKIADYQSQLDEYDLSSFDLLDDDTASLLDELGIDDFDYENISSNSGIWMPRGITRTSSAIR